MSVMDLYAERITKALEQLAKNTKTEDVNEEAQKTIADLKQVIRNYGMEMQMMLDNPPSNGLEMARQLRGLAARMSVFGVPEMFR